MVHRAAGVYGSASFEDMRAKCIGQDLSWEVPAQKWEAVLQELRAGKPNRVRPALTHHLYVNPEGSPPEGASSVIC